MCSLKMLFRLLVHVFLYSGRAGYIFSLLFAEIESHTLFRPLQPPKLTHSEIVTISQLGNSSIHNTQLKTKEIWAKFTLSCESALTSHLQEMNKYYLLAQNCNFSVHFLRRSISTMLQGLLRVAALFHSIFCCLDHISPHASHLLTRFLDILDIVWPVCCASGSPDTEFSSKMALCYS